MNSVEICTAHSLAKKLPIFEMLRRMVFVGRYQHVVKNIFFTFRAGTWGGVVVKALRYLLEGCGIDPQWCRWGFVP